MPLAAAQKIDEKRKFAFFHTSLYNIPQKTPLWSVPRGCFALHYYKPSRKRLIRHLLAVLIAFLVVVCCCVAVVEIVCKLCSV